MNQARVIGNLSMGSYYLGELSKDLRDLKGYAVFAQELIQNADDAKGNEGQGRATQIIFDITDAACIVWNNGSFSDCGCQDQPSEDCPWLSSHDHLCDLHRFRLRASADKRNEEGTTGGFGIGFVSVYQITDHPELHSGNIHWRLHPERSENARVDILDIDTPEIGTRITLPWATDGETNIRRKLALEPVTPDQIEELAQEIATALPQAILFLRHLTHLELRRNGKTVRQVVCVRAERQEKESIQTLIVEDSEDCTIWHVLEGGYAQDAHTLREKHGRLIEKKRQSRILLAIPETPTPNFAGRLCATLPTQEMSRLPLHINADFYPASNRKRILFEHDYQGEWNAAAIRAAARTLAAHLPDIKRILGAVGLWSLANQAHSLSANGDGIGTLQERCFATFWQELKAPLAQERYIFATSEEWVAPANVHLIKDPTDAINRQNLLMQAGINIVHPSLRPFYGLLRDRDIGVRELGAVSLAEQLRACGLNRKLTANEVPDWYRASTNREMLAQLIAAFGIKVDNGWHYDATVRQALETCSLVLTTDGHVSLPQTTWCASAQQQQILACLPSLFDFLAEETPEPLRSLCPQLTVSRIIACLAELPPEDIAAMWRERPLEWMSFLTMLDTASPDEWDAQQGRLKQTLRQLPLWPRSQKLPLWPSGQTLFPLTQLKVPGGFEDPLELAMLLDGQVIRHCATLLQKLEPEVLDLSHYATVELPKQFDSGNVVSGEACDKLLQVLAKHLGELRDNQAAQKALSECPLILCTDDTRRIGQKVYLDSELVRDVLASSVPVAVQANSEAITDLYRWLRATEMPRGEDVVARIQQICQSPPDGENRRIVQRLIANLGRFWDKMQGEAQALKPLSSMEWIPAIRHEDIWYIPGKVYAIYSQSLFATQAEFVDLPLMEQNACRDFFVFLGIPNQPTSHQIVHHLLTCASNNDRVTGQVYTVLQDRLSNSKEHDDIEPALHKLKGTACLYVQNGYVRPSEVYWDRTPFGRYARHLDEDAWKYRTLFSWLGVQMTPTMNNVFEIMESISTEFGTDNRHLDDESLTVFDRCWRYLNDQLATMPTFRDEIHVRLGKRKIIADTNGFLFPPWEMCFENRPLLANKFHKNLRSRILIREQGTWQALEAAGVRPFSQCVLAYPTELDGEQEITEFTERLSKRRHLLDRVIEPQAGDKLSDWNLALLDKLKLFHARLLRVAYQVEMGGRIVDSATETPDVFCDTLAGILYFRSNPPSWTALAREIVYALNPNVEAGTTAITLSLILGEASESEAENDLDEAGFARLGRSEHRELVESAMASLNVEDGDLSEVATVSPEWEAQASEESSTIDSASASSIGQETMVDKTDTFDANELTRGESTAVETRSGKHTNEDKKLSNEELGPSQDLKTGEDGPSRIENETSKSASHGTSEERGTERSKPTRSNSQGGRLYSYVTPTDKEEEWTTIAGDGVQERREATEMAGIEMAMEYERQRGRFPKEMPPNHPGYDIVSLEAERTTVARYIEVKAIPVRWGGKGVGLTAKQFHTAENKEDQYWLYVVECAGSNEAQVIPIQNPALQVGQFYFDAGWKSVSSTEEAHNK